MFARRCAAVAAAAVVLAISAASPAAAATYTAGHFDLLDVDRSTTGAITLDVKSYSPANDDLAVGGNTFVVGANTLGTVGSGLACLGTTSDPVYRLPQSSTAGRLHAGWNAEDSSLGVTLTLVSASVPSGAKFALYQTSLGSAAFKLNTNAATGCAKASFPVAAGTHAHGFWAFTKPGGYALTFKATASDGAASGNVTYAFQVG